MVCIPEGRPDGASSWQVATGRRHMLQVNDNQMVTIITCFGIQANGFAASVIVSNDIGIINSAISHY
jgi:hypothetical protein